MTKPTASDTRDQLAQLASGAPGADAVMTPTDTLRDAVRHMGELIALTALGMKPPEEPGNAANRLCQLLYRLGRDSPAARPEIDRQLPHTTHQPALFSDADLAAWARRTTRLVMDMPHLSLGTEYAPADPVAEYVAAHTPPGLARRPGDLLHEAFLYVMGDDHDHGEQAWHDTAAHFQQLLAQGAQPEPTDLPMDGSTAADPNPMAWVDDSPWDVRLFLVGIVLALIVVGFIIGVPVGMLLQDMRAGG